MVSSPSRNGLRCGRRSNRPASAVRSVATLLWAATLLTVASVAFADVPIYSDGFEIDGFCGWSAVVTPCWSEADVAALLTGQTLDVCIPEGSGSNSGLTFTMCGSSTCTDGVTTGCPLTVTINSAAADFATGWLTVSGSLDAHLPFAFFQFGIPMGSCTTHVSGTASGSESFTSAVCTSSFIVPDGVFGSTVALDAESVTGSGCGVLGPILTEVWPLVWSSLSYDIENAAEATLQDLTQQLLVGHLLCSP